MCDNLTIRIVILAIIAIAPASNADPGGAFAPSTTATWVQNGIYLVLLVVGIWQVSLLRKQIRESDYLRCQNDFTESLRLLMRSHLHNTVYDTLAHSTAAVRFANWDKYDRGEKFTYGHFELLYELLERIYVLQQEGVVPAEHWSQWRAWMEEIAKYQLAADVYCDNRGMFDPDYEAAMLTLLKTNKLNIHCDPAA